MAVIFDGREFAKEKEEWLKVKVTDLKKKGITPKLVSILVGKNPASVLYVNLKKAFAERISCELLVERCELSVRTEEIIEKIEKYNSDKSVHGIMIQLPLPDSLRQKAESIMNSISPEKDVDGLREKSPFLTPTVRAVFEVIKEASPYIPLKEPPLKVVVVGHRGFEGRKFFAVLKKMGYQVEGVGRETTDLKTKTKNADILITATGSSGIISSDMVKKGVVLIDVGAPKGDIQKEAYKAASFVSPVPGGVGPATVAFLMENLVLACERQQGKI